MKSNKSKKRAKGRFSSFFEKKRGLLPSLSPSYFLGFLSLFSLSYLFRSFVLESVGGASPLAVVFSSCGRARRYRREKRRRLTMEDDKGTGYCSGDAREEGGGTRVGGDELVFESKTEGAEGGEREKDAAPPAVEEQLRAPSLDGLVIDAESAARAERVSLAVTEEGGAADQASALGDKDVDAEPPGVDKGDDAETCECFVGGLPPEATEEQLLAYFEDLNPLSARVNRRRRGGECKGYGFVVFPSAEIARRACKRDITVSWKDKRKEKSLPIAPTRLSRSF